MIQKFLIVIIAILSLSNARAQREVININTNWSFTRSGTTSQEPTVVNIPHTWNYDALAGDSDYYRGMGSYVKTIEVPKEWLQKSVFLRIKGANQRATLYVNSKHIGEHKGGYTAFGWDISPYLVEGVNYIWLRVSNAMDMNVMPLTGQFNIYGGIYRDVDLIVTPKTHVAMDDCATESIFVSTTNVNDHSAKVGIKSEIYVEPLKSTKVTFRIYDNIGAVIDQNTQNIEAGSLSKKRVQANFSINNPNLWNSIENPYLYSASITTTVDGVTTDSVATDFGLRYWSISEDNKFLLNGQPFQIRGVTRHQDNATLANAIYPINHQKDIELMQEMGVNAVRLTYYPQDPYFIDLCDKAGIMVWSEIPFVGTGGLRDKGFVDSQPFMDNARTQLKEMIKQLYNHPSILWWGLFNELSQRGDDPKIFIKSLNEYCKELDPTRTTVAASNQDGDLNFITDLIGFNQKLGWANGEPNDIEVWAKALRRNWSSLKVGLSEYGAGGSNYQHTDKLVRPAVDSYWHPESWQTHFHECYWRIIDQGGYFWGTFINSMFDYGVASLRSGQRQGIDDSGLVTFDRMSRKDAFYFYKANWNPNDKFVHIAQKNWIDRESKTQEFRIYSNCAAVELIVNGKSMGVVYDDGFGTFVWQAVELRSGENNISAHSLELSETDECSIRVR